MEYRQAKPPQEYVDIASWPKKDPDGRITEYIGYTKFQNIFDYAIISQYINVAFCRYKIPDDGIASKKVTMFTTTLF